MEQTKDKAEVRVGQVWRDPLDRHRTCEYVTDETALFPTDEPKRAYIVRKDQMDGWKLIKDI